MMKASLQNRAEDKLREVKGAVKEAAGTAIKKQDRGVNGRFEKHVGKAQGAAGRIEKAAGK
jgi:uncharacterized protein YjbJ (UPF0337 family)